MPKASRTAYQKNIFKEICSFCIGSIKKPWRHELRKNWLQVYWLCKYNDLNKYRRETNIGILLDWCEERDLSINIKNITELPYYKYIRHFYPYQRYILIISIPAKP